MRKSSSAAEKTRLRDEQLERWGEENGMDVERLAEGQKWIIFVTLQVLAVIGDVVPLKRIWLYFLVHCGLDLGSTLIGVLMGTSDRNVRYYRNRTAPQLWQCLIHPIRGHRCPKLGPEHAGLVAKYLVAHPGARIQEILHFINEEFGVEMDRLTVRRYLKRYGLGCLRDGKHEKGPLFSAPPSMGAPFF